MALDELNKDSKTYNVNGIELMIAENLIPHTAGNQIEFIDDHRGKGFAILPISGNSCGC